MFVVEQIGHVCVGGPYRRVLEAASVGCDSLVGLNGEELRDRSDAAGEDMESWKGGKETCIIGIWIVRASSPFKLPAVCGQEDARAV